MKLVLLQREVLGDDLGDRIESEPGARPERPVSRNKNVSRGGGETERRQSRDLQREPKFQIKPGRWHGRMILQRGASMTQRDAQSRGRAALLEAPVG